MFIWFLSIVIFIAVVFLISLYIYDSSEFKKITNYSYFQAIFNKQVRATYKLFRILKSVHKNGKILLNIKLPDGYDVIDAIYIQPSGVYVIDLKNMTGWLYGHEKANEWTLAMFKEKVLKFQNPLLFNGVVLKDLQKALSMNKPSIFHAIVVFTDNTVFKKLTLKTSEIGVINLHNLKSVLKKESAQNLSEVEMEEIYKSLASYTAFTKVK